MGLFINSQYLYNKRGAIVLQYTSDFPDSYDKAYESGCGFGGLYNLYLKMHPLTIYRFLDIDVFIKHKNLEFELTEAVNPEMMDNDAFYAKLKEYGAPEWAWANYSKILEDKSFDERKKICESLVAFSQYSFDKYGNLLEIIQYPGDFMELCARTNITKDYKRKYKAGDKALLDGSVVEIINMGPDDSIPYSCLAWSERYYVKYEEDGYIRDWIKECDLIPLNNQQ